MNGTSWFIRSVVLVLVFGVHGVIAIAIWQGGQAHAAEILINFGPYWVAILAIISMLVNSINNQEQRKE